MRIVINRCFGGFSLSTRAIKALCDRKGEPCFFYTRPGNRGPWIKLSDEEAFAQKGVFGPTAFRCEHAEQIPSQENWHQMTQEEKTESNRHWTELAVESGREIERNDPNLIAVVEELGAEASGACAELAIVEVPDDVQWSIEEYDGSEWVAESHRTWR